MRKNTINNVIDYASRNLQYGGIAMMITAAYIITWRPSNIILLLTPYTGDTVLLCGALAVIGGIALVLGYYLKRWRVCRQST